MGYVGLPLVLCFGRKGYSSNWNDIDQSKVDVLANGRSYIKPYSCWTCSKRDYFTPFYPTHDFSKVSECDAILIAVPTPLNKNREPELQYIVRRVNRVTPISEGQLIVLESSTYPGTTDELVVPYWKKRIQSQSRFFVGFRQNEKIPIIRIIVQKQF